MNKAGYSKSLIRRFIMRICAMVFTLSFIFSITVVAYSYGLIEYQKENGITNLVDNLPENIDEIIKPSVPEGLDEDSFSHLKFNKNLYCVLFIGVDTDTERIANNMGYQSDVLMLIATDIDTKKSTMISIPRDTLAWINKLNSRGEIIGTKFTKINAAFSQGGGMKKYSCENASAAVQSLLDIPRLNYIAIDMTGVGPLTSAIGGVDLVIDADFSKWGMPKGTMQHLEGDKALRYVRERKGVGTGGSDIERTKRQLRFVNAYIKKVQSINPVTTFTKNYKKFNQYVHTNISYQDLYAYAQLTSIANFNSAKQISLPGVGDEKGNWIVNENELATIRNDVFFK